MKPDLDSIYSELDLQPNCSLEEFQRAYRRRIAELHPDRPGPSSHESQAALRDLIWVYAMVTRFHRRYGRMPGGYPPHLRRHAWSGPGPTPRQSHSSEDAGGSDERRRRATLTLVLLFVALVILLASWSWLTMGGSGSHRGALPVPLPVAEVTATICPPRSLLSAYSSGRMGANMRLALRIRLAPRDDAVTAASA